MLNEVNPKALDDWDDFQYKFAPLNIKGTCIASAPSAVLRHAMVIAKLTPMLRRCTHVYVAGPGEASDKCSLQRWLRSDANAGPAVHVITGVMPSASVWTCCNVGSRDFVIFILPVDTPFPKLNVNYTRVYIDERWKAVLIINWGATVAL